MKEREIGIDILRVYLAFQVVLVHGWEGYTYPYQPGLRFPLSFLSRTGTVAVPTFVFISFYFTDIHRLGKDKSYFRHRLKRLLIPQVMWAWIYFVIYKFLTFVGLRSIPVTIKDLLIQIFIGHGYNEVMWFQIALIMMTLILAGVSKLTKDKEMEDILLIILFWICIVGQYSGINGLVFEKVAIPAWGSFGRICEVIPIAIVGTFFNKYNILNYMKEYRKPIIIGVLLGLMTIYKYQIFVDINGYAYSGFWRQTVAVSLVVICGMLPLDSLSNKVKKILIIFSKATPGVYYLQRMVLAIFTTGRTNISTCFLIFVILISISALVICSNAKYVKYIFI